MSHNRISARLYRKINRCGCGPGCTKHCWLWQGCRDEHGYGRTRTTIDGKEEHFIHRVAWAWANGRTAKHEVCHSCDNPPCCNPCHLWEGTHAENHQDSQRKGRRAHGLQIARPTKLTANQVVEIFQFLQAFEPHSVIAKKYGVSQPLITNIANRKVWKHVPCPWG